MPGTSRSLLLLALLAPSFVNAASTSCSSPAPDAEVRIHSLRGELLFHNDLYYRLSSPAIEDGEYDRLFAELLQLERCHPQVASSGSPTVMIPSDAPRWKLTLPHERPMQSLRSSVTAEAVQALLTKDVLAHGVMLLVQPKVDGLPIELVYLNGRLVSAATRGDGSKGADVTEVAARIPGIPQQLTGEYPERVVVRGEVYADRSLMAQAKGMKPYATPRHFAAAILKSRYPDDSAISALRLFPFEFVNAEIAAAVASDTAALRMLALWGFPISHLTGRAGTMEEVRREYLRYLSERDKLPFAADGIVVKVDDLALRRILGEGARAPFWAAAWKFPPQTASTTVRQIRWKTGRSGRRTPVAEVAPVTLGGVRVTHVSLQNPDAAARLGVTAGDRVIIAMVGDIIPQVLHVEKREGPAAGVEPPPTAVAAISPTACLSDTEGCREQFLARAVHFVSRKGLDVRGLGAGQLRKLVEAGLVHDLPSIIKLDPEELAAVPGIGESSARRLTDRLRRIGRPDAFRLLAAIGIPGVGPDATKQLARRFGSLEELLASPETAKDGRALRKVRSFFGTPEGKDLLKGFREVDLL
jgi:DNA ligase (NAD+)